MTAEIRDPEEPVSTPRRRALGNPPRALDRARGAYSISGFVLGLIAVGIVLLTDCFLRPPVVYLVNIGALYVTRYVLAVSYAAAINIYWKQHADLGHPDELDLVKDHRYINVGTAVFAACLAIATLVVTDAGTPTWMLKWWVLLFGTAFIGAATAESLLSFTPMWFYINILRRFPHRNPVDCERPPDSHAASDPPEETAELR